MNILLTLYTLGLAGKFYPMHGFFDFFSRHFFCICVTYTKITGFSIHLLTKPQVGFSQVWLTQKNKGSIKVS